MATEIKGHSTHSSGTTNRMVVLLMLLVTLGLGGCSESGSKLSTGELAAALADDKVKQRLKNETQSAINAGVIGSPYFIVDGEGFWGSDRMWMIRRWIERGGW